MAHAAIPITLDERLAELCVPPDRVRMSPMPGTATLSDLVDANTHHSPLCELVDGCLVEKTMGFPESVVAGTILFLLKTYTRETHSGIVSAPDGMFELFPNLVSGPDVAYIARDRLPEGKVPREAYPHLAPNLAVEVLSPSNTKLEMARKRREYFHAGVQQVWLVDIRNRSVAVYTSSVEFQVLEEHETLTAESILPGLSIRVSELFADLD